MSVRNVALVDYGSGNLRSVEKGLERAGAVVTRIDSPEHLQTAEVLVVPGVGAFGDAAMNLKRAQLWDPIADWLAGGKPYLGICLGYQLLFNNSEESPGVEGFGYISGSVRRFPQSGLKVPHMGWNSLSALRGPLFENQHPDPSFYFVHSYYPCPDDPSWSSATCNYGISFPAAISRGNVHATQFHPEKSQEVGRKVLEAFLNSLDQ